MMVSHELLHYIELSLISFINLMIDRGRFVTISSVFENKKV